MFANTRSNFQRPETTPVVKPSREPVPEFAGSIEFNSVYSGMGGSFFEPPEQDNKTSQTPKHSGRDSQNLRQEIINFTKHSPSLCAAIIHKKMKDVVSR